MKASVGAKYCYQNGRIPYHKSMLELPSRPAKAEVTAKMHSGLTLAIKANEQILTL